VLCALAATALGVTATVSAATANSAGSGARTANQPHQMTVGTYQPQNVFRAYSGRAQMMKSLQGLEKQVRAAQKSGNRKQAMKAQKQLQQRQQQMIQTFKTKMNQAIRKVAKKQHLDLVVGHIAFKRDAIQKRDVTKHVIAQMNQGAGGQQNAQKPQVPQIHMPGNSQ